MRLEFRCARKTLMGRASPETSGAMISSRQAPRATSASTKEVIGLTMSYLLTTGICFCDRSRLARTGIRAQFIQRVLFDLPDTFAGDSMQAANLLKRSLTASTESVA